MKMTNKREAEMKMDLREEIENIMKRLELDSTHDAKRVLSFNRMDKILEKCNSGKCTGNDINEEDLYLLCDISINGYINQRAYYYHIENPGLDKLSNYLRALNRVTKVFSCNKQCRLNKSLFKDDYRKLVKVTSENSESYYGARRRKAYWSFLSNKGKSIMNSRYHNYCSACELIEQLLHYQETSQANAQMKQEAQELLSQKMALASGVDLFRFCLIRSKVKNEHNI